MFMTYETYQLPDDIIFRAMQRVAAGGGMAVVHAENGAIVAELSRELEQLGRTDPRWYPSISPPVMEGEAAHRALALAQLAGCRLLLFHLTTTDSLAELRRARDAGQAAFGEALLHHLLLGDELYLDPELAPQFMGTPPLRPREHRDALWRALAEGTLDVVSTDHGPRRRIADESGRLRHQSGTSGVEVRLALMHDRGVLDGRIDLQRWVDVCCTAPARLHGLPQKGRLEPGRDADIVLFDPAAKRRLSAGILHSDIDHSHLRRAGRARLAGRHDQPRPGDRRPRRVAGGARPRPLPAPVDRLDLVRQIEHDPAAAACAQQVECLADPVEWQPV